MKKSFSMAAAMMAAAVLSVSSFVSCDEEEENNGFKSETFSVELQVKAGTGYSWQWTNATTAAADSVSTKIEYVYLTDAVVLGGNEKVIWTFKTKENGEEVLKFRYLRPWDESTVVKDTVITFKK